MLGVILTDAMLVGRDPAELEALLHENLGFDDDKLLRPMSSLSGSWRMKLAFARCCLITLGIILLDEPTNHLDHRTVEWSIGRLQGDARDCARRVPRHGLSRRDLHRHHPLREMSHMWYVQPAAAATRRCCPRRDGSRHV